MGFFDLLSDAKDSMDKRRQAREYIQRAKELVREGDDIYERAYNKVISYASETEYKLRQHNDYKKQLAKELSGTIDITLRDFGCFNIDAKTISAPSVQKTSTGLHSFESTMSSFSDFKSIISNRIPYLDILSILDMFISDDDYYEAKRQHDEAKRYKEHMKMERDKLNNYKEKMSEIRSFISSERSELDSLIGKLRKMIGELKDGMQKSNFSIEEAQYLKGIHKIAEWLVTLLSTDFLNDAFSISQRYQKVFSEIKNINQNLPYAPSITDSNTVAVIKRILDWTIIY